MKWLAENNRLIRPCKTFWLNKLRSKSKQGNATQRKAKCWTIEGKTFSFWLKLVVSRVLSKQDWSKLPSRIISSSVTSKKSPNVYKKLPKDDFTSKMKDFDNFTKIVKKCGKFGQNKCCQRLWKVSQSAINCPIWSHWLALFVLIGCGSWKCVDLVLDEQ